MPAAPPSASQPPTSASGAGADFTCGVCFDVPTEPVVTRCGHLFCWGCLDRWLVTSHSQECPVCKGLVRHAAAAGDIIPLYGKGRCAPPPPPSSSAAGAAPASAAAAGATESTRRPPPPPPPTATSSATSSGNGSGGGGGGGGVAEGTQPSGGHTPNPRPRAHREDAPPRPLPAGGYLTGLRNGGFFLFVPGLISLEFMLLFGLGVTLYFLLPWRQWLGRRAGVGVPAAEEEDADRRRDRRNLLVVVALIVLMIVLNAWLEGEEAAEEFVAGQRPYDGTHRHSRVQSSGRPRPMRVHTR